MMKVRVQQPISRDLAVHDTRSVGKTTMIAQPQHRRIKATSAHDKERNEFFRGHALGGPSLRASMGGLGDSDYGVLSAPKDSLSKRMPGFSFGSPDPNQGETVQHRGYSHPTVKYRKKVPLGRIPGY